MLILKEMVKKLLLVFFILGFLKISWAIDFSAESPFRECILIKISLDSTKDNLNQDFLSKEELKKRKIELGFKTADYISELLCAYNLDFISERLWQISSWVEKERRLEKYLKEKYSIKLDIDIPKKAFVFYTHRF